MYLFLSLFTAPLEFVLQKTNKSFSQINGIKIFFKVFLNKHIPRKNSLSSKSDVVVSLTVINSRIKFLRYTLNALLRQKALIKKIIVNYSSDIDITIIKILINEYQGLVTFRHVEDFGSHRKYFFLSDKEKKCRVFLTDDDMVLDRNVLKDILKISNKHKDSVTTLFGWRMQIKSNKLQSRDNWQFKLFASKRGDMLYWSHNAYTLFPKNFFSPEVFDKEYISHSLSNKENNIIGYDDSWLNFHRLKKELSVYYARPYSKFFLPAEFQNSTITLGKACIGKFSEEKIFEDLFKTLPTEKF